MWVAIGLGVVLAAAASVDPATDPVEQQIRKELDAKTPEASAAFRRASDAYYAGRFVEAIADFQEVIQKAPDFGPAHRRLAMCLLQSGQSAKALVEAEEALRDDPSVHSRMVLAQVHLSGAEPNTVLAVQQLDAVLHERPNDPDANYLLGVVAARKQDVDMLDRVLSQLLAIEPQAPRTLQLSAAAALMHQDRGRALAIAKAADAQGDEKLAAEIRKIAGEDPWYQPLVDYGPWFGLGWAVTLGILFVVGFVLSRIQIAVIQKKAEQATATVSGAEKLLLVVYQGVILLTMAFFYLSIPLCVVLVFLAGGGLMYLFFAVGQIPIKLVAIIAIATLVSIFALIKGLFTRPKDDEPGKLLTEEEQPQLYALLRDVAQRLGTRPVEAVYMTPGTDMAVTERGGFLATVRGKGRRTLVFGLALVDGMNEQQLRSILAHEYGHFVNGDLKIGALVAQVQVSLFHMLRGMGSVGRIAYANPAFWMLRLFYRMYLVITFGSGRMREVMADRGAANLYGGKAFADGLRHVVDRSALFDSVTGAVLKEVATENARISNFYARLASPGDKVDMNAVSDAAKTTFARSASAYDSHPAPSQRIQWVERLPGADPIGYPAPAADLLADREKLDDEMSRELHGRMHAYLAALEAARVMAERG